MSTEKLETRSQALDDQLRALMAHVPVFSSDDLDTLHAAAQSLDFDPSFQSDCLKSHFVSKIVEAMAEEGVSKSILAHKWKRSRQYLGRILDEDRRVNFTIETMVELSMLLERRLKIDVVKAEPTASFVYSPVATNRLGTGDWLPAVSSLSSLRQIVDVEFSVAHSPFLTHEYKIQEENHSYGEGVDRKLEPNGTSCIA